MPARAKLGHRCALAACGGDISAPCSAPRLGAALPGGEAARWRSLCRNPIEALRLCAGLGSQRSPEPCRESSSCVTETDCDTQTDPRWHLLIYFIFLCDSVAGFNKHEIS